MNIEGFCTDLEELKKETYASISSDDFTFLKKMELWGRLCTFVGFATAWIFPNPISALAICLGISSRWLLMHHINHKGYDKVPGIPKRYTSKYFAKGWRRFIDWFDWIHPNGWEYEHNILHHYHTSEDHDPDVVEPHLEFVRSMKAPRFLKYILVGITGLTWKYTYYAPNTMSVLEPSEKKRLNKDNIAYITIANIFQLKNKHVQALWIYCYIPYVLFHFILVPAAFLPLGQTAALNVLITRLLAECFANIHSFMIVGPNHTGDDLFRFDFHYENKAEFYASQVLSSVNYTCGDEITDFLSFYLNYQIEHHLFPDLPMNKYTDIQPKVKALCEKHGLPYKQESVFKRFKKMTDICVGNTSMPQIAQLPV